MLFRISHYWNSLPQETKEVNVQLDSRDKVVKDRCFTGLSSDSGNSLTVEREYHYCVLALFPHTGQPGQPLLAVAPISIFTHDFHCFRPVPDCCEPSVEYHRPHRNYQKFWLRITQSACPPAWIHLLQDCHSKVLLSWADPGYHLSREQRAIFSFVFWDSYCSCPQTQTGSDKVAKCVREHHGQPWVLLVG